MKSTTEWNREKIQNARTRDRVLLTFMTLSITLFFIASCQKRYVIMPIEKMVSDATTEKDLKLLDTFVNTKASCVDCPGSLPIETTTDIDIVVGPKKISGTKFAGCIEVEYNEATFHCESTAGLGSAGPYMPSPKPKCAEWQIIEDKSKSYYLHAGIYIKGGTFKIAREWNTAPPLNVINHYDLYLQTWLNDAISRMNKHAPYGFDATEVIFSYGKVIQQNCIALYGKIKSPP